MRRLDLVCLLLLFVLALPGAGRAFDPDAPGQGIVPVPPPAGGAAAPAPVPPPGAPPAVPGAVGAAGLPQNVKPISLFITPAELAKINAAIEDYKRAKESANKSAEEQAKNFLNQLDQQVPEVAAPPKPVTFIFPQFYLERLSYRHQNDWLVQINGHKFGPGIGSVSSWIKIIMVDKDSVVVEWTPQDMEKVNDAWILVPDDQARRGEVIVDSIRETVTFTLHPNQTFSSYAMRVLEGKVQPVSVTYMNGQPVNRGVAPVLLTPPPAATPTAAATATATAPVGITTDAMGTPTEPKEGAKALNETYKKIGIDQ